MAEQVMDIQEDAGSKGPDKRADQDRRNKSERRSGMDRRSGVGAEYKGPERRKVKEERRIGDMERRRGPGRRRCDERRSAEEGEMTDEQFIFIKAIEEYKRINKRPFPSYTEILEVAIALGYRKVAEPTAIKAAQ